MSEQLEALARGYAEARAHAKEYGPAVAFGWLAARVESILVNAGFEDPWATQDVRITLVKPDGSEETTVRGSSPDAG